MPSLTIRDLDDALTSRLQAQAVRHGRSIEDEALDILRVALEEAPSSRRNLAASIRQRFSGLGGVALPPLPREPMREPPVFER